MHPMTRKERYVCPTGNFNYLQNTHACVHTHTPTTCVKTGPLTATDVAAHASYQLS